MKRYTARFIVIFAYERPSWRSIFDALSLDRWIGDPAAYMGRASAQCGRTSFKNFPERNPNVHVAGRLRPWKTRSIDRPADLRPSLEG